MALARCHLKGWTLTGLQTPKLKKEENGAKWKGKLWVQWLSWGFTTQERKGKKREKKRLENNRNNSQRNVRTEIGLQSLRNKTTFSWFPDLISLFRFLGIWRDRRLGRSSIRHRPQKPHFQRCALLCFVEPTLGNRSRGMRILVSFIFINGGVVFRVLSTPTRWPRSASWSPPSPPLFFGF